MKNFLLTLFVALALLPANAQEHYYGDGPDDYLRFVPITAAVALKAFGVESASSWRRFAVNSIISIGLTTGTTYVLKQSIHERRPDWTDRHSFPSGHTSFSFAGATILHKEFHHVSPWISVAGYAVAAGVAIDRVARNRHEWQDVVAGAAIGVGGTMLGYWLGDKITGDHSKYYVGASPDGVQLAILF